ncbi:MAG: MotE family protein [Bacteriovoracia bacterium]
MIRILICIALLLVGINVTIAKDKENKQAPPPVCKPESDEFNKAVKSAVHQKIDKMKTKNIATLIKELLDREEKLHQEEERLKRKEEMLKSNEVELQKKIAEFQNQQKSILGCIDQNKNDAKRRVVQMIQIFSNMKPAKAAEVLSVQDSDIAIKILADMNPERVSKIFNVMDKEISARLQKQYMNMKK